MHEECVYDNAEEYTVHLYAVYERGVLVDGYHTVLACCCAVSVHCIRVV